MHRRILKLAVPNIISNITVPLLGMVDLAIVGHLGSEIYIGAIAVGSIIFNFLYWNLGFLRMGTSGFAAQAYGRKNFSEAILILKRSLIVAGILALLILLLQYPIRKVSFYVIKSSSEVAEQAYLYFKILIWAAPAILMQFAIKGWFIGMQNSKIPMWISVIVNVLNILFSLFLVLGMGMKVEGVALGSLAAQYGGLISSFFFFYYGGYRKLLKRTALKEIFKINELSIFFKVNGNIFLRTICLVTVFTFFTSESAKSGDTILAVNTLLMQLFTLFSYVMDGFAYAGEALTGRYVGAGDTSSLKRTVRSLFYWGFILGAFVTIVYYFFGTSLLSLLTNEANITRVAETYFYWVLAIPLVGVGAFLWDGIYIGASASRDMRNIMFLAMAAFFAIYYAAYTTFGINALWAAFLVFLGLRGLLQYIRSRKVLEQAMMKNFTIKYD